MAHLDTFLFSANERSLLSALSMCGRRPRDIMRETGIPHASLYLAFEKLSKRGFAKRFVKEGKLYWKRVGSVQQEIIGSEHNTKVFIHSDQESVKECINQILDLRSGDKVTIVEGTQKNSGWFELFSKKETMALNKALSSKKIVCESILPESYFSEAIPRLGKEWALSYTSRPIITYIVRKSMISSDAILITLRNKVIILYAKDVFAVEIENQEIVALIKGMIEIIKESGRKVHVGDDFSFSFH